MSAEAAAPLIAKAEEQDGKSKRSTPSSEDQARVAGIEIMVNKDTFNVMTHRQQTHQQINVTMVEQSSRDPAPLTSLGNLRDPLQHVGRSLESERADTQLPQRRLERSLTRRSEGPILGRSVSRGRGRSR